MSEHDSGAPLDRNALIADYVIGQMDAAEAATFEREIARDATLAAEVAEWQERLAEIDATAAPMPATGTLWSRIEGDLAAAVQERPGARVRRPGRWPDLWTSLGFWRAATLALAAFGIVSLVGFNRSPDSDPAYVAVLLPDDGGRAGAVVEIDAEGHARLVALTDIAVPEGRALQIWTLQEQSVGPVSVGLIPSARSVALAVESLPATRPEQLFEITLEPAAGSPTGRPTGPILFKGTTARAL